MVSDNAIRKPYRDSGYLSHVAQPSADVDSSLQPNRQLRKKGSNLLRRVGGSLWNGSFRGKQVPPEPPVTIAESRESNENETPVSVSATLQGLGNQNENTKTGGGLDGEKGLGKGKDEVEMIDEQQALDGARQHPPSEPIRTMSHVSTTTNSESRFENQVQSTNDRSQPHILPRPTNKHPGLGDSSNRGVANVGAHGFGDIYSESERFTLRENWSGLEGSSIARTISSDSDRRGDWNTVVPGEPSILRRSDISPVAHVTSGALDECSNYEMSINTNHHMRNWTVSTTTYTTRSFAGSCDEEPLLSGAIRCGSLGSQHQDHDQSSESLRMDNQGDYRSGSLEYRAQKQSLGPGPSSSGSLEILRSSQQDDKLTPLHMGVGKYLPALTGQTFVGKNGHNSLRSYPDISGFRFPPPAPRYPIVNPEFGRQRLRAEERLYAAPRCSEYEITICTPPRTPIFHTPPPPGVEYIPVEVEPFLVPHVTISPDHSMIDMCMEINRMAEETPGIFTTIPAARNGNGAALGPDPTVLGLGGGEPGSDEAIAVVENVDSDSKKREGDSEASKKTITRAIGKAFSRLFSKINKTGSYHQLNDAGEY